MQYEAKVESHLKLVEALVDAGYSSMVNEVSSFIDEMRRITVLWDELWFGILTQHLDDFNKRVRCCSISLNFMLGSLVKLSCSFLS